MKIISKGFPTDGYDATPKDFKDSFVINNCIESFSGKVEELMSDDITSLDQSQGKTSKSVNFISDCYEKICAYSKLLNPRMLTTRFSIRF